MTTTTTIDTAATPRPPSSLAADIGYRWRWVALFVILAGEVMDLLDSLITIIAGPSIQHDLGGGETLVQWLSAGYTVAMAAGLLAGARLGDIYGKAQIFTVGAGGFAAFSLLCAVSQSPTMLITARVLQGLFGAMMLPQGLGLIKEMFPPNESAQAFGLFGPVMGLSAVGGPILGGWLVTANYFDWGWRMIFAINLPLGIFAVVGALRFLPRNSTRYARSLDLVGVALAAAASVLLIYPLVQGREQGWPVWTFVLIAAGVAMFAVFGYYESARQRGGREPLITPSLFRNRSYVSGLAGALLLFIAMIGISLILTLFTQVGLGYTPLKSGLAGLPQAIGTVVGFGLAAPLQARLGRTLIQIGATVMAGGLVLLALMVGHAGIRTDIWTIAPGLAVIGVGLGIALAPLFDIILAGVSPEQSGSAAGVMTATQQLGSALGVAVMGTIFFSVVDHRSATEGGHAFVSALQTGSWVSVGLLAATFGLIFLMPKRARDESPAGH